MSHDSSAIELALIGTLIRDPEAIELASARLNKSDFSNESHGRAFEHLVLLREAGKPVSDRRFVVESLRSAGIAGDDSIAMISKDDLLAAVHDAVPANVSNYCDQIIASSMLFAEKRLVFDMQAELESPGANPFEICRRMQSRLESIASRESLKLRSLFEHSKEYIHRLKESRESGRARGLPTGLPTLDNYIGGLVPGELIFVAARPSHGKTSLGWQMLEYNAEKGVRCLFVSLEMKGSELSERMLSTKTGVESSRLRRLDVSDHEITQLEIAAIQHRQLSVELFDERSANARQIRALAKLMQSTGGIDLLCVDYLQIMKPMSHMKPTHEQLKESAEALKSIARELGIPVICLAQLNRSADKERPALSHIKGGGGSEEAADVVILIHNPKPESGNHSDIRRAELILAKGRNVDTGTIVVNWCPGDTTFLEI